MELGLSGSEERALTKDVYEFGRTKGGGEGEQRQLHNERVHVLYSNDNCHVRDFKIQEIVNILNTKSPCKRALDTPVPSMLY
jgi:hypothetical protein